MICSGSTAVHFSSYHAGAQYHQNRNDRNPRLQRLDKVGGQTDELGGARLDRAQQVLNTARLCMYVYVLNTARASIARSVASPAYGRWRASKSLVLDA